MKQLVSILLSVAVSFKLLGQSQLPTPKWQVLSGNPEGVELLFDNNLQTGWFPGWDASKYPVKIQLDFGEPVVITKVKIYDGVGKPTLTLLNRTSDKVFFTTDLSGYLTWQEREVSSGIKTQYVILSISDIQGDIPLRELIFFGGKDIVVPPTPTPVTFNKLTGDARKLGMNGFHWIPNDLLIFPNLRVYQMSQWTWTPNGLMTEPSYQADANYDKYFKSLKDLGVQAVPCINTVPDWMSSNGNFRMCYPQYSGNNPTDYIDIAKYVWQYTARYGSKTYPANLLTVNQLPRWNGDVVNEKKSGLNLLTYLEFENEPDRPWNDDLGKYTPEQLAAFLSAIWDGHEGRLGSYVGAKNADPNIKVVMPALAEINLGYLLKMKEWFEKNRTDKRFCADVINVHHYSNSSNPLWPAHSVNLVHGKGIHPEADLLEYRLKDLKQFVVKYFPKNTEVWFSEFGYDTYEPSQFLTQYPLLYTTHTAEELQSWWLQRIFLIGLSAGMDKMYLYNGIDQNYAASGNLFASSGIMYGQNPSFGTSFGKKPSYLALQSLVKELDGYTFNADRSVYGVTILEFKKGLTKKYFYWCPTAEDAKAIFKIGRKELLATEFPQVYSSKIFQKTDILEESVLIQIEKD